MNFDYSEEQQLLANSVNQFIAKDYTFEARKAMLDSSTGYSEQVWATFAEMGLLGLPFPSEYGGFSGTAVDLMPVMEAIGEGLVLEPYLATVGLGGQFVARGGSEAQKQAIWHGLNPCPVLPLRISRSPAAHPVLQLVYPGPRWQIWNHPVVPGPVSRPLQVLFCSVCT